LEKIKHKSHPISPPNNERGIKMAQSQQPAAAELPAHLPNEVLVKVAFIWVWDGVRNTIVKRHQVLQQQHVARLFEGLGSPQLFSPVHSNHLLELP
jgi:hypothetical protein